ncbi:hypothetical protein [Stakelama pacifica]|uniref:Uncharacterized protein n=1 Tax=Stakelama pacifica TaxID=517720 RepID=A0A4R6FK27_9SPHN|nr:hypothetical protein [Stakelama pacifica]TDN81773.1 hypothetical protein EV664_107175 [Stakelama pacifica]GGO96529.1 hypothetical protein GCM10011329_23270 [Stakelama pacifica]
MTPLERAARALTATLRHHGVEMHPDDIRGCAIDVIAAIREPSNAMMRSAVPGWPKQGVVIDHNTQAGMDLLVDGAVAFEGWQAMIDALLAEGE